YGLYIVKLALLLVMIGGTGKQSNDGLKVRGEMHLLLVGDPGTAKSQFLKYAAKLSPRSVLTTGVGTTSAGLTVAAVRDGGSGGEWMLEAGALVLADRGVCCIDEFSSIRENEKTAVHEVMEQQTISGAKAGMIINLNARCTIIAATNAKGKYDVNQSLSVNVGLASPLLSRFDLVLILSDNNDRDWDAKVADFILGLTTQKSKPEPLSLFSNSILEPQSLFGFSQLQSYIQHVKSRFNPTSTRESELILTTYYQFQRQKEFRSAARTTIRLLESLIRLSQAHARLMFRDKITKVDAVMAVYLMEFSNNNADALHINFPDNPDKFYRDTEKDILQKLGLTDQV
ncbi:putative DNA helicase MCM9, partial [Zancudomyces culisetae]